MVELDRDGVGDGSSALAAPVASLATLSGTSLFFFRTQHPTVENWKRRWASCGLSERLAAYAVEANSSPRLSSSKSRPNHFGRENDSASICIKYPFDLTMACRIRALQWILERAQSFKESSSSEEQGRPWSSSTTMSNE